MDATGSNSVCRSNQERPLARPVGMTDLRGFVDQLLRSWRLGDQNAAGALVVELRALSSCIQKARAEIAAQSVGELQNTYIPSATDQLDAIVEMTAEATNRIMSAAESCEAIVADGEGDARDRVAKAVTEIYEACAFQDITGQRVRKVVLALQQIEAKLDALLWALDAAPAATADSGAVTPTSNAGLEATLLEGPQLVGKGTSQAEIDALFNDG